MWYFSAKPKIAYTVFIFVLYGFCFSVGNAQDKLPPGRSLPGGTWQPYNTKAAIYSSEPVYGDTSSNPLQPLTWWGEDVRVSYLNPTFSHWPEIAASGNSINIVWWYLAGDTVFIAKSVDGGLAWISQKLSDDSTLYAVVPQISASGSHFYVVYRGARINQGVYLQRSSDYGESWYSTQRIYYTARNYADCPVVASQDSMVYITADIEVNYVPPNQNWDTWLFRSSDFGASWPDTFFVSDTTSGGKGPDLAVNNFGLHLIRGWGFPSSNTLEVLYSGSSDGGETWFGPITISDFDTIHSFWPQIAAWGDSNVAVSWTDYKASPMEWSGDAFFSKSTDNGHSWSPPYQLTFSHGVEATDLAASGDTIIVTYNNNQTGNKAIYATISLDGGVSWQEELRVSDSPYYCSEPSVAISNGLAHISWSDSRNNPQDPGLLDIYYDRGTISTGVSEENNPSKPENITIRAYPNPFNSACIIYYSLKDEKGGELAIYNIQGQKINRFNLIGKEGKIIWDARDAEGNSISSGIYFAKAGASQSFSTIKLVHLR